MTREGNRLIVELPEGFDPAFTPAAQFRLGAEWAGIAKLKLVERPQSTVIVASRDNKINEDDEISKASSTDDEFVNKTD